ncbi:MAG: LamG domain-containing protein, partial [Verrucomicrobiaceae bacterium]
FNPAGNDLPTREFIKFTPNAFEYHRNDCGENVDYVDQPVGTWVHNVVVKQGNTLNYFRDGRLSNTRTITQGLNNPLPFYMGGNKTGENWKGLMDDVAIWSDALPVTAVAQLARGGATPLTASTTASSLTTVFSETFSADLDPQKWTATNRGLENNGPASYNEPKVEDGKLTLGGTTSASIGLAVRLKRASASIAPRRHSSPWIAFPFQLEEVQPAVPASGFWATKDNSCILHRILPKAVGHGTHVTTSDWGLSFRPGPATISPVSIRSMATRELIQ